MPPVKVKVKFFAPFRELFAAKEKELVFDENPVSCNSLTA